MLSSFYPIVSGRVSDALTRNRSLYQAQTGKMDLQRLQDQLSSGMAFTKPSENPISALQVISNQRQIEYQDQRLANLQSANSFLQSSESNLASITSLMTEARGIALEAATTTASDSEKDAWLQQINSSLARLQSLANTQFQDRYLFTGGVVSQVPVSESRLPNSNGIVFHGNDLTMNTIGGAEDYISHNVLGQSTLGLLSKSVSGTADLAPSLSPTTKLTDLNNGAGVSLGSLQFSNGIEQVNVDLTNAEFVQDVLNKVNGQVTLAGRPVELSIQGNALHVAYADGLAGPLKIVDPSGAKTAYDLGIESKTIQSTMPFVGKDVEVAVRPTTQLSQLHGGAGFDWVGGLRIRQGSQVYDVDFSGAATVEDALHAIESSGALVSASISANGRSIEIKSRLSGIDFSIGEANGQLASQLGVQTLHGGTRLSELNYGQGVEFAIGPDLSIQRNDGTSLQIDLDGAFDLDDVIQRINDHPDNQNASNRVTVSISASGGGLQLSSIVPPAGTLPEPSPISIRLTAGSNAASALGLIARGEQEAIALIESGEYIIQGRDPNPQEVSGVFNSLIRLRDAVAAGDLNEISRASQLIDQDLSKLNLSQGSIGIEQSRIESLTISIEDSQVRLKSRQSDLMEVDMVAAITELNARQVAYEASLRFLASASQLSLFNYL